MALIEKLLWRKDLTPRVVTLVIALDDGAMAVDR